MYQIFYSVQGFPEKNFHQHFSCSVFIGAAQCYVSHRSHFFLGCTRFPHLLAQALSHITLPLINRCLVKIVISSCCRNLHFNYKLQLGRDYFAGLRVTKRNKATVLLTLTLLQTPTLTLILTLTLT
jgi:hypothetical protein